MNQGKQAFIRYLVVDVLALPPGIQDPGIPQYHQVLGDIGLALLQRGFQMADAGFAVADSEQELDPERGAKHLQVFSDGFL